MTARLARRQPRRHRLLTSQLQRRARLPVLECWANRSWQEDLATWLLLARLQPNGAITCALLELDLGGFGAREVLLKQDLARSALAQLRAEHFPQLADVQPNFAKKMLEAAVMFSAHLGFEPPAAYLGAAALFSTLNSAQPAAQVVCGVRGDALLRLRPSQHRAHIARRLTLAQNQRVHWEMP